MKKSANMLVTLLVALTSTAPVFGWGDEGHQAVGKIASLRIKPQTTQCINQLLKPGETLAAIATWADRVKYHIGEHDPDPDTDAFLQDDIHNKDNPNWHFVDLPLGCTSYQTCNGFQPDNDIVHLIKICIRTLQGHPDANHPLSETNALRLLVHFIGDLHQPLHVGTGFIDPSGPNHSFRLATDPVLITQNHLASDRGGNQLIIDHDRKNLHSFWDFDLVKSLMNITHQETSEGLGSFLVQTVAVKPDWNTVGTIETWASQWATDSLRISRNNAYNSVRVLGRRTIVVLRNGQPLIRDGQQVTDTVYDITRANDYDAHNRKIVEEQLAKAGFHLAKLLVGIYGQ